MIGCWARFSTRSFRELHPRFITALSTFSPVIKSEPSHIPQKLIRRNLFTEDNLGISSFVAYRNSDTKVVPQGKERFIERLKTYIDTDDTKSVFVQDIETLIKYADNDEHLDMLDRLIEIFMSSEEMRAFEPERQAKSVCKLYYLLGKTDRAYNNLLDTTRFGTFFNSQFVFKLVMTMLYNAGRFEEAIKLYDLAQSRLEFQRSQKKALTSLALASYAKINTPEAFEDARKIFESCKSEEDRFTIRQAAFLAYMAISNNDPRFALNLISVISPDSPTLFPTKVLSLIKLRRYEDMRTSIVTLLNIANERPRTLPPMSREVLSRVNDCLSDIEDEPLRVDIQDSIKVFNEKLNLTDDSYEAVTLKPHDDDRKLKQTEGFRSSRRYEDEDGDREDEYRSNMRGRRSEGYQGGRQEIIDPTRAFRRRPRN